MPPPKNPKTSSNPRFVERRGMLDNAKKDEMLAVLIRNPLAYETARSALTVDRVQEIGQAHAVVWSVVRDFYEEYEEPPTKSQIETEVHNRLHGNPELLDADEVEVAEEFLDYTFDDGPAGHGRDLSKSRTHRLAAIASCKAFLEEVSATRYREVLLGKGRIVADLPGMLKQHAAELDDAATLTTARAAELFPDGWDQEASLDLTPTGIKPMDALTGGGLGGGEVLVFMAPYGSCKTLVGVEASCRVAMEAANAAAKAKGRRQVVFLISTEMTLAELRIRALMCLAKIPRKRLADVLGPGRGVECLCQEPEPAAVAETKYEEKLFASQVESEDGFQNEYQRVQQAMRVLSRHLIFLDCTDANPDRPHFNQSGMIEIRDWVKAICRADKKIEPILFVLDHASALAQRELAARNLPPEAVRHVLKDIPRQAGELLGKVYDVPFIVFHQLAGDANNRGPAADLHHTDAAECKAFAEYADFAVTCTRPAEGKDQIVRWRVTKHRREPPRGHRFVRIVGRFGFVRDVTKYWTITPNGRTLIRFADLDRMPSRPNQIESGVGGELA